MGVIFAITLTCSLVIEMRNYEAVAENGDVYPPKFATKMQYKSKF
jgi:hypothetical protein